MKRVNIFSISVLHLLTAGLALVGCSNLAGSTEEVDSHVPVKYSVSLPSADEEASAMLNYLRSIKWFDDNGYTIALPSTPLVEAAKTKLRSGASLSATDEAQLREHFKNEVYDPQEYQRSYERISGLLRLADKYAMVFNRYEKAWGFFIPPRYTVKLTLYGPGGSYNSTDGSILMAVRKEDTWNTDNGDPLAIILHESVHIGIEEIIIQRYNISQIIKERIVDNVMTRLYGSIFPGYWLQDWGYSAIDVIFEDEDVLDNLPVRVGDFIRSNK